MDAETYEERVLAAVRSILESAKEELQQLRRTVTDVRLRGSYPSTEVVVAFLDRDQAAESIWPIWLPPTQLEPSSPEDTRIAPESVATLVYADISEP
jgi:hypothetical protein